MEEKFDARFGRMEEETGKRFDKANVEFNSFREEVNVRFGRMEEKHDRLENKIDNSIKWMVGLLVTVVVGFVAIYFK